FILDHKNLCRMTALEKSLDKRSREFNLISITKRMLFKKIRVFILILWRDKLPSNQGGRLCWAGLRSILVVRRMRKESDIHINIRLQFVARLIKSFNNATDRCE